VVKKTLPTTAYGMTAVSCPTTLACWAVGGFDSTGVVMVTSNGARTWTRQVVPAAISLWGVSCFSASRCVAVGESTSGTTGEILRTADGGAKWVQSRTPAISYLDAVHCVSAEFCVAVGASIVTTTDGGVHWRSAPLPSGVWYFGGVTCTSMSDCLAVGTTTASNPVAITATTTDGGADWIGRGIGQPFVDSSLAAVSCWTVSDCTAVGSSDNGGLALTSTDGGDSWTLASLPADFENVSGVSCLSSSDCVAVGTLASYYGFLTSADGGLTWTSQMADQVDGAGLGLSCASTTFCATAGEGTRGSAAVLVTGDGGDTWTSPVIPIGVTFLASISCASAADCMTVGSVYNWSSTVMATTNGGATWTHDLTPDYVQLAAVSCPTSRDCITVGTQLSVGAGGPVGGFVSVTTDGGRVWTTKTTSAMTGRAFFGVSCPTAAECVVVGQTRSDTSDSIFVTNDFGATWANEGLSEGGLLTAVSCPNATTCFATGSGLLSTTDGGTTWVEQPQPPPHVLLWSISCATATACVTVGSGDTGEIMITTDGGLLWTTRGVSAASFPLTGVSCSSQASCVAVGASGESILSTRDSGKTWAPVSNPFGYDLDTADCLASGTCFAEGGSAVLESATSVSRPSTKVRVMMEPQTLLMTHTGGHET
jgi:hypothetical protein